MIERIKQTLSAIVILPIAYLIGRYVIDYNLEAGLLIRDLYRAQENHAIAEGIELTWRST